MATNLALPVPLVFASLAESATLATFFPHFLPETSIYHLFPRLLGLNFLGLAIYQLFIYPFYVSPLRHVPGPKEVLVARAYEFEKPPKIRDALRPSLGNGLLVLEEDNHKFVRKTLMPLFGFRQIKALYPLFWEKSMRLTRALHHHVAENVGADGKKSVVDISQWSTKVTLDIIGLAAMGRDFRTLEHHDDPLVRAYEELLEPTLERKMLFAAQTALREEIRTLIASSTQTMSDTELSTALEAAPLLNGVCNESLRLYPTIPLMSRSNPEPMTLLGHHVPAGTRFTICPAAVNRSPEFWGADADKFVPQRWIDTTENGFDPFVYTQGHWLDRDQTQREARILKFDFDALLDTAVKCSPGALRVVQCEKKEGGFNRVFMIQLDNDATVVACLPTRLAVKQRTDVPVPNVLAWSSDRHNNIGVEYMIQEAAHGVLLKDVWNSMSAEQRLACIQSIGLHCRELSLLQFPMLGALYLTSTAPPNAVKIDDYFSIGPLTASYHWGGGLESANRPAPPGGLQGPWHDLPSYFRDLIARSRANMSTADDQKLSRHAALLDALEETLSRLARTDTVKDAGGATLFHPDLHTRNIFVDSTDHTKVTSIFDWQSAAIEPAFVFASVDPDFAEELSNDEDAEDASTEDRAANARFHTTVEVCVKMRAVTQRFMKKVRPASKLHPTLLRVLTSPSQGWTDKIEAMAWLLNDLSERWNELGLPGESVYKQDQTGEIAELLDGTEATHRLTEHLTRLLHCDNNGRVAEDRWNEVLARYRLEYSRFVESVVESEECKTEEDKARAIETANRLWPYDQR
ncbi:hypothetical protein CBER1_11384 [Cercospora berteroae]|uniref:Altered inheritance of mitochondria protein 9, mitochondrial n=1 Tax=Cercospora berteroae TaxID=357750 RepID=A0A2S6CJL3_9PEZI|nr:hypothetical protein CBER1_11384 [Cercospora berteroae]